ncbi:MAG: hypothetical protein JXR25_07625 [Pontiellaceae bacterium]|nr:hypothetical protein [Pontiellaceae bacterium]MBN2784681.1 hypothetical protein [Pontiellaceae bacterium]
MTDQVNHTDGGKRLCSEELLDKLLHLKQYEVPEIARMTRNRQNIMREVRSASRNQRKSFGDLIEGCFPWLFAEPKYGVAMLLVAFAGLQYLSVNARHAALSDTGIYTSPNRFATYAQPAVTSTNAVQYDEISPHLRLFRERQKNENVKWVNYLEKE